VTAQIGFATVLLVLAGLFTQSLMNAARTDIGMSVDSIVSFNVSPLLAGRDFNEADRASNAAIVVNESFARKFGLSSAALGQHVRLQGFAVPAEAEIVGVVPDVRFSRVKGEVFPQFYTPRPRGDTTFSSLFFYVRTGLNAETLLTAIPRAVASVDPNLPVANLSTMRGLVDTSLALDRVVTLLSTALAALATVLAAIGLYGVLSYNVAQRTRELGLRLALGAQPRALRLLVLRQVGLMTLIGATLGLAACEQPGPAPRAGQSIDRAGQNLSDAVNPKGPAEKAGRAVDRALGE
jgi:ABC-type antimicrobial peptide transport system permease subunit